MTADLPDRAAGRDALRAELLRAVLGDTDGGLVLDGDLPASEIARLTDEEAVPLVERFAAEQVAAALNDAADWCESQSSHAYDEDDEAYEDCAADLRARAAAVLAAGDNDRRQG